MEKEKYEKPEIEVIDLLYEIFTEESPEDSGGDIFDDEEETEEGTEETGKDIEGELDENGNPINPDSSSNGIDLQSMGSPEETDLSGLNGLIDEINEIVEGSSSEDDTTGTETGNSESELPVEEEYSDTQQDVPTETFEEPTGGDEGSSSETGFDGGTE